MESILGLHLGAQDLHVSPCLPSHGPRAEITLTRDGRRMPCVLLAA